jgi:hypothetical protein
MYIDIIRVTMNIVGPQMLVDNIDQAALSAFRCRVQVCKRKCRSIDQVFSVFNKVVIDETCTFTTIPTEDY